MATRPISGASSTGAQSLSGGKKKQVRGPQKRTFHFFVKVTDEAGNAVPGAKLHVERIITDARKVIEFMDTPEYNGLGLTRIKYETTAEPRDDGDGAASTAAGNA